eukprot:m.68716 g.68716  ORF g.68716 m.68716 type:complete len:338 (+) comp11616_c0_seq1:54-1067(+)
MLLSYYSFFFSVSVLLLLFLQQRKQQQQPMTLNKNCAFCFVKPHTVNDKVVDLVKTTFKNAGLDIVSDGVIEGSDIDSKQLIDTHYGAIASKAVKLNPSELNVPQKAKAAFNDAFGLSWEDAVAAGKVFNAKDAAEKLGVDASGIDAMWSKLKRGENLLKFGGGFYCGNIGDIFVINGFYMAMRQKYTGETSKIHYFVVQWDASALSWEDFRGKLLGATDPSTAEEGAVRRKIFDQWEDLGLASEPNVGDNGVHGSASPFEALAERNNWIGADIEGDIFGSELVDAGIPLDKIKKWFEDPQVRLETSTGSLFDALEDKNSEECFNDLLTIQKLSLLS